MVARVLMSVPRSVGADLRRSRSCWAAVLQTARNIGGDLREKTSNMLLIYIAFV
jgi:hypothetical protein